MKKAHPAGGSVASGGGSEASGGGSVASGDAPVEKEVEPVEEPVGMEVEPKGDADQVLDLTEEEDAKPAVETKAPASGGADGKGCGAKGDADVKGCGAKGIKGCGDRGPPPRIVLPPTRTSVGFVPPREGLPESGLGKKRSRPQSPERPPPRDHCLKAHPAAGGSVASDSGSVASGDATVAKVKAVEKEVKPEEKKVEPVEKELEQVEVEVETWGGEGSGAKSGSEGGSEPWRSVAPAS